MTFHLGWADTAAIAWQFNVAPGTIRRWASEDRWTPLGTRRTRQWDLEQARISYERRRATAVGTCTLTCGERRVHQVGVVCPSSPTTAGPG